jgi:threonyl-tRNA synthetase
VRILSIHADYIRYKATKKTRCAEEISRKADTMDDCVVLFACVEKLDEINPAVVISSAEKSVRERLDKLKVRRVMVFPYAHLTSALGSPSTALAILKGLEDALLSSGLEVKRAPFGWYKEFELKNKGHPLADLSMTICPYEGRPCDFECPYCHNPIRTMEGGTPSPQCDLGIAPGSHS